MQRMNANERNLAVHGGSVSAPESAACDSPGLVNKRVVARATSASMRSVDNWIAERKIPVIRISPRCIRFHLPSVLAALRKYEVLEVGR
jgi:hypothetical protein